VPPGDSPNCYRCIRCLLHNARTMFLALEALVTTGFWAFAKSEVPLGEVLSAHLYRAKEPSPRACVDPLGGYAPRDTVGSRRRRSYGHAVTSGVHSFTESQGSYSRQRSSLRREPGVRRSTKKLPSLRAVDQALGEEAPFAESLGLSSRRRST
jgi:hypothetical protein